ncbi:transposase-like protein [Hydrogenophaga laconesensis]|jgi:putative transposase|uniref:Transposase-like protein n=2 Tax=root TaxID=1 RepID=A0ABU1VFW8_9BURK|nr:transposase-like protein [Hydrogenophaga laconesensis]
MGFKTFHTARRLITDIETMHMIRKGQMNCPKGSTTSVAQQFYSLTI